MYKLGAVPHLQVASVATRPKQRAAAVMDGCKHAHHGLRIVIPASVDTFLGLVSSVVAVSPAAHSLQLVQAGGLRGGGHRCWGRLERRRPLVDGVHTAVDLQEREKRGRDV